MYSPANRDRAEDKNEVTSFVSCGKIGYLTPIFTDLVKLSKIRTESLVNKSQYIFLSVPFKR